MYGILRKKPKWNLESGNGSSPFIDCLIDLICMLPMLCRGQVSFSLHCLSRAYKWSCRLGAQEKHIVVELMQSKQQ